MGDIARESLYRLALSRNGLNPVGIQMPEKCTGRTAEGVADNQCCPNKTHRYSCNRA